MKEERAQERWQARSEDVGTAPYLGSCGELQSARELHLHNHTIARGPIITDVLTEIGLVFVFMYYISYMRNEPNGVTIAVAYVKLTR